MNAAIGANFSLLLPINQWILCWQTVRRFKGTSNVIHCKHVFVYVCMCVNTLLSHCMAALEMMIALFGTHPPTVESISNL